MGKGAWILAAAPAAVVGVVIAGCGGKGQNPIAPTAVNRPPEIKKIELVGYNVAGYGSSLPVVVTVSDPDGDQVRCTYQPTAGRVLVDGSATNTCAATYVAPGSGLSDAGGVTARDTRGASTSSSATLALGPESISSSVVTTPPPPGPGPAPAPGPAPPPPPPPTPTPPPGNHAPTVTVSAASTTCHPRPSTPCGVTVTATGRDPDGDSLTFSL